MLDGRVYSYTGHEDWDDQPSAKLEAVAETAMETSKAYIRASGFARPTSDDWTVERADYLAMAVRTDRATERMLAELSEDERARINGVIGRYGLTRGGLLS
jgi:hypothetical protein